MHGTGLAGLGPFILTFGLVSKRVQTTPVTAPMAFVLFRLLAGPAGLGLFEMGLEARRRRCVS
jgi:hypothetical protein